MKLKSVLLIVIFLFLLPLCFSKPVVIESMVFDGYYITSSAPGIFKLNENISINWHVFNSSGFPIKNDTVTCKIHIYNTTGFHLTKLSGNSIYNDTDEEWEIRINTSLYNKVGFYDFIIQCNDSSKGGYLRSEFEITPNGLDYNMTITTGTVTNTNSVTIPLSDPYQIIMSQETYTKIGDDPIFYWKIKNMSGGLDFRNLTDCYFYLYSNNNTFINIFSYERNISKVTYDNITYSVKNEYSLSINSTEFLSTSGEYNYKVMCNSTTIEALYNNKFILSSSGNEEEKTSHSILLLSITILLLLFMASLIFAYTRLELQEHSFYKAFLFFMVMILGIISIFTAYVFIINSTVTENLKTVIEISTITFGGLIILVSLGYWLWYSIQRNIEKAESEDD